MAITTIDPKTALVVIDLQNGIVALPGAPVPTTDVVKQSAALAEAFRARDLPVVLVNVERIFPRLAETGTTEEILAALPTAG